MATSKIMLPSYASMFAIEQVDFSFSDNEVTAGSYKAVSKSVTKSGWYPVGIAGWDVDGTRESFQFPYRYYLGNRANGSVTVYAGLYNRHTSNPFSGSLHIYVLWQKVA